jgi:MFS family permease
MQLVRGLGISLVEVGTTSLVQRTVPRHLLGRVFANLSGAAGLAAGLSYLVGGALLGSFSAGAVLTVGGAGGCAATAALAVRMLLSKDDVDANDERE